MNELKPEEITKEKSLFAIFRASIFVLPISKLNAYSTLLVATFLFCMATNPSTSEKLMMISLIKFSEIGLNFSGAILGFLIAGFTIFASVSDKKIFVDMASIVEPKTNLTYLKYNFFRFYMFLLFI